MQLQRTRLFAALGLILLTIGGAFTTTTAAQDAAATPHPFAGDPAWIAYQTYRDDSGTQIGLVHLDGTDEHLVATDIRIEQHLPNWSADGTRLVFTTRGGVTDPLFEYELATDTSRQLFACEDPCLGDDEPAYSPDGTKVVFTRVLGPIVFSPTGTGEVPSDCGLWIGDVITGEVAQITSNTDPPCDREYEARWSPDGSQLAYWRDPYKDGKPTGTAIFVIDADGTNEQRLTDPAMFAGSPNWSPDGEWIVFSTYPLLEFQCCQVSNLYRMHVDGTGMEQLTSYETDELRAAHPSYSPDGKWILFSSITPDTRSLWVMPADGGGESIVILEGNRYYGHGAWQPTGDYAES